MVTKCKATTAAGAPCTAQPLRADGFCFWHSPAVAAERQAGRRRGGRARSNANRARKDLPPALTPAELQQVLGSVLRGVIGGRVAPNVANAWAALGRTLIAIREATEVEERLTALEAAAAEGQPPNRWRA